MIVDAQRDAASVSVATTWGMLAAIDLYDCARERVSDGDCIRRFIDEVVPAIGMRAHGPIHLERFGGGALEGWSALQFIETSSITVHADEVFRRCFIDVFSCREFDAGIASRAACRWFGGTARITVLRRGGGDA